MCDSASPVANLMSDGDAQVKACVLRDHTAPFTGASPTQLRYTPDLVIPIRQQQVIPISDRRQHTNITSNIKRTHLQCRQLKGTHTV